MRKASGFSFSAFISSFIPRGIEPRPDQVSFRSFLLRWVAAAYRTSQMNRDRATWAYTAIRAFEIECMAGANEDDETIMGDLVCDSMHYCAKNKIKWKGVLAAAESHFEVERDGRD
jgi:capsid protein